MRQIKLILDRLGMGLILILLCLFFSLRSEEFLSAGNFSNILIQSSVNIMIAVGMTFVISAAEIDLSVGSLLALCGMITALSLKIDPETGMNLPMAAASYLFGSYDSTGFLAVFWWIVAGFTFMVCSILPGTFLGGVVGWIVVRFGVPSFIVTLGFMMIYRGFARYLTDAAPVIGMPIPFMNVGSGSFYDIGEFRISYSFLIAISIVIVAIAILNYTRFGRHVLAVGGNRQASFFSGVPVERTRFLVFVLSGFCVSVAAIVQTSRLFIGDPNAGEGYELDAIAAVIIGGTSLFGGKGTVLGTVFGALIIGVLRNGLDFMDASDHVKQMVIGSLIIFAVLLDYYRKRWGVQTSND